MPQSADRKPERYIGPDGKPKIRMVPVDREVIKGEVKKYTPPSQADIDADKKKDRKAQRAAGIKRPSMTPGSLKRRQYSGLLGKLKRESVNEISRSMTPMSKRFGKAVDAKKFDAYKKHVKKHNVDEPSVRFIDDNPNHMQAKRAMKDKHMAQAVKLYKAAHKESVQEYHHDQPKQPAQKKKPVAELSMTMKDVSKTGLNKAASPDKDKLKKDLEKLKKNLGEKLKVSDGIGSWIKDFQASDAPQFKGKDKEERRDMAIAAYLSAKRGN